MRVAAGIVATIIAACAVLIACLYGHSVTIDALGIHEAVMLDARGYASALTIGHTDYQLTIDAHDGIELDRYTY